MRKAIYIEESSSAIKRVLAIAPESAAPELDGRKYFVIEDYELPNKTDQMTKAYPIWNSETKQFGYIYENWFETINQDRLDIANLKAELSTAIAKANKTTEDLEAQKAASQKAVVELTQMIISAMPPTGGGINAMPPMSPTGA